VKAGGLTLRQVEAQVKKQLEDGEFFANPQLAVSIEQYKSQKVFIVGEVRSPGTYPLSGDMNLVEALARAGSTLPSASGEAIIVHPPAPGVSGPTFPIKDDAENVARVDLRELQNGMFSLNVALRDGDTIFVPRGRRPRLHVAHPHHARRQRPEERAHRQADRRRAARRHDCGAREVLLTLSSCAARLLTRSRPASPPARPRRRVGLETRFRP
jgi:hypothetical protein